MPRLDARQSARAELVALSSESSGSQQPPEKFVDEQRTKARKLKDGSKEFIRLESGQRVLVVLVVVLLVVVLLRFR